VADMSGRILLKKECTADINPISLDVSVVPPGYTLLPLLKMEK